MESSHISSRARDLILGEARHDDGWSAYSALFRVRIHGTSARVLVAEDLSRIGIFIENIESFKEYKIQIKDVI
jgi:hypothetical protein